jgi:NDP-sugar pyrophosphorylase family protein
VKNPTQAIILCGGLGTRLMPLTADLPKPMVPVNGKPFIAYLLNQLKIEGIISVILLTGYKGEKIREFVGDGQDFGLSVKYSHGPVDWDTGRRVWEVRQRLEDHFFLLYSDNYAPFSAQRMTQIHMEKASDLTLLLHAKTNGNIKVLPSGLIQIYDETRATSALDKVEVGYMLVNREVFLSNLEHEESLVISIKKLVKKGRVFGVENAGQYQSISDPDRLLITERFFRSKD